MKPIGATLQLHLCRDHGSLFEMGFAEQLNEVIGRLPHTRQTLLFSATLPKILVRAAIAVYC